MATKGMRQPHKVDCDDRTVLFYGNGKPEVVWKAPNLDAALEYCAAATCEWQVREYGGADPSPEIAKVARSWSYPVLGDV